MLAKIAVHLIAQDEAAEAAFFKVWGGPEETVQDQMRRWKRLGPSRGLFPFAMVHPAWRAAQLKVGRRAAGVQPLDTRVLLHGRVALVKWAVTEGFPMDNPLFWGLVEPSVHAALYGHLELVQWLVQEKGCPRNELLMSVAARSGNLELVQWLRAEGCPWDWET